MNLERLTKAELIKQIEAYKEKNNNLKSKANYHQQNAHETSCNLNNKILTFQQKLEAAHNFAQFSVINQIAELKSCANMLEPFTQNEGKTHREKKYIAELAIQTMRRRMVRLSDSVINHFKNISSGDNLPF